MNNLKQLESLTGVLRIFKINWMVKIDIGKTLHDARTSKGIILEEVERATHIRLNYLLAIEENRFQEIPCLAYVKAYIRKYAEFLGLDPAPLLSSIENSASASYLLDLSTPVRKGELFYRRKNPLSSFLLVAGVALLFFLLVIFFLNWLIPPSPLGNTSAAPSTKAGSLPSFSSSSSTTTMAIATPTVSLSPSPSKQAVQFQVEAINQGTLEVIINGKVQFQGQLSPGQKGTWRGESFTLNFDNPQNFRLLIEGQEVSLGTSKTFQWPQE